MSGPALGAPCRTMSGTHSCAGTSIALARGLRTCAIPISRRFGSRRLVVPGVLRADPGLPCARSLVPAVRVQPRLLRASGTAAGASGGSAFFPQPGSANRGDREGSNAPLRLVDLPGKGRGLVAARKLNPGELLMVCRPLALVRGQDSRREPQQQQQQQPVQKGVQKGAEKHRAGSTGAGMSGSDAARSVGNTTAPAPAMAAECSEAALVSELLQLPWSPRQVKILGAMYRGPRRPAPTGGSRGTAATATPGSVPASGGRGNSLDLDLLDLLDPWVVGDGGRVNDPPAELSAPSPTATAAAASAATAGTSSCPSGQGTPLPSAWGGGTAGQQKAAAGQQAAAAGPGGSKAVTHGSPSGLTHDELAAVVRLNATGLPSDDLLLAKLYGRQGAPYIGLWPAHAMLNHSCAPNAVAVVSDGLMWVRCCAPVPAGGEVCITYSGALGLGPLPLRRALLERNHRFRCMCVRCTAEEHVPRELAQLWSDIVMLVSQLQSPLTAASAMLRPGSDGPVGRNRGAPSPPVPPPSSPAAGAALQSLLEVRGQVTKCCGLFEETLEQLAPSPQEALWLQASMYPLYETRARCAQLLLSALDASNAGSNFVVPAPAGPVASAAPASSAPVTGAAAPPASSAPDAAAGATPAGSEAGGTRQRLSEEYLDALSACLRLQGVANAGSDMHVQLAARYANACAAHAARHPGAPGQQRAAEARQRLERVLSSRYGARHSAEGLIPPPTPAPSGGEPSLEALLACLDCM